MYFGTFKRVVDVDPREAEEGDWVFMYKSDDGWRVGIIKLHDGAYDTENSWAGNPVKMDEYALDVQAPGNEELPDGLLPEDELVNSKAKSHLVEKAKEIGETYTLHSKTSGVVNEKLAKESWLEVIKKVEEDEKFTGRELELAREVAEVLGWLDD